MRGCRKADLAALLPYKKMCETMRKSIILSLLALAALTGSAQEKQTPFKGYFWNEEFKVYLRINLHDKDVNVPAHELFGPLPGYLGKQYNNFVWLITDGKPTGKHKAEVSLINDYGSEDLKATLTLRGDSVLTLKQGEGSVIKVPNKGKWQKLPKALDFKRR